MVRWIRDTARKSPRTAFEWMVAPLLLSPSGMILLLWLVHPQEKLPPPILPKWAPSVVALALRLMSISQGL